MNALCTAPSASGSQPHDKGRILWICGRVLRTGASPAGRVDSPWTTRTRCPPACPHSRASRPQAPQDQPPVILTRQHRTTLRRGCLHRPFRTTSASHSNPSQHRPRPGSPPILQAHFRMGLDSLRTSSDGPPAECVPMPTSPGASNARENTEWPVTGLITISCTAGTYRGRLLARSSVKADLYCKNNSLLNIYRIE